jgi:phage conserved hypothetical protein, phiE125 gp8 family
VGSLAIAVKPTAELVSLAEARAQCRVTHSLDDAQLAGLITDAREWAQGYTRRLFMPQTWDYRLHCFTNAIALPVGPVQSISSITYYDTSNVQQTLSAEAYDADLYSAVPTIRAADGYSWPSTYSRYNAVTVRFVGGYATGHPDLLNAKQGMLLYIEAHYDRDERTFETLVTAAERKLDPLRVL